jgi:hypothetical protein
MERTASLTATLNRLEQQLVTHDERLVNVQRVLDDKIELRAQQLHERAQQISNSLTGVSRTTVYWRGALAGSMAIGGFVGWLVVNWARLFPGAGIP